MNMILIIKNFCSCPCSNWGKSILLWICWKILLGIDFEFFLNAFSASTGMIMYFVLFSPYLYGELHENNCSFVFPFAVVSIFALFTWCSSQVVLVVKNPYTSEGHKTRKSNAWLKKIPWRRTWQPTPGFLSGESREQRSLVGYSPWGGKESDTT